MKLIHNYIDVWDGFICFVVVVFVVVLYGGGGGTHFVTILPAGGTRLFSCPRAPNGLFFFSSIMWVGVK